jgi:hypothetical protein
MNKVAQRALLVVVLGGGYFLTRAWAQEPTKPGPPQEVVPPHEAVEPLAPPSEDSEPDSPPDRPRHFGHVGPHNAWGMGGGMGGFGGQMNPWGRRGEFPHRVSEEEMKEFASLHKAVEKLKNAKNDADKTSATNEISQLLDKWFKRDLDQREKQVAEIEARVKKLREQIEKRNKAKDEIIKLRLKTIVNEADGLGFPGGFDHGPDSMIPRHAGFGVHVPNAAFHFEPDQLPGPPTPPTPSDAVAP